MSQVSQVMTSAKITWSSVLTTVLQKYPIQNQIEVKINLFETQLDSLIN